MALDIQQRKAENGTRGHYPETEAEGCCIRILIKCTAINGGITARKITFLPGRRSGITFVFFLPYELPHSKGSIALVVYLDDFGYFPGKDL